MNQRAHIRHQVDMPATVSFDHGVIGNCHIQDFCLGGMMLFIPSGNDVAPTEFTLDQILRVTLTVNGLRGPREVGLSAKVRRIEGELIGVSFESPDSTVLLAVQNHVRELTDKDAASSSNRKAGREYKLTPQQTQKATDVLAALLRRFIIGRLEDFLPSAREALMVAADAAHTNQGQLPFFEAEKTLNSQADILSRNFVSKACKRLHDLAQGVTDEGDDSQASGRLSLVDQEIFEDWLTLKVMATRAEGVFHDELLHLQLRMDQLYGIALSARKNPLHPVVICTAFGEALRLLPLKQKTDRIILAVFERTVVEQLGALYAEVNNSLVEQGVLPDLDVGRYISENYAAKAVSHGGETAVSENTSETEAVPQAIESPAQEQSAPPVQAQAATQPAVANTTQEATASTAQPAPSRRDIQSATVAARRSSTVSSARLSERQFALQQHIARHAYETVRKLLSEHSLNEARERRGGAESSVPVADDVRVEESLASLQRSTDIHENERPLIERVATAVNDGGEEHARVDSDVHAAIDVIHHLFEGVVSNPALTEKVRTAIKRLEVPFLRLLLVDDEFLTEESHPARQMLNRMAHLGVRGSANLAAHEQEIEQEVDLILGGFDRDINVFSDSLEKLDKMASRQQSIYLRNIKRVTESCEGKQKLQGARREVSRALERRIGGKRIPKAVLSLVDAGWRPLLAQALLRHGRESKEWHRYLGVIDQMLKAAEDVPTQASLSSLLSTIKDGLGKVDHTQMQNARLISELRDLLSAKARAQSEPEMVDVPTGVVGAEAESQVPGADELGGRWIKRAQRYVVGDWFSYFDAGQDALVRLAWVDSDGSTFVFVNHQGMKIVELRVDVFAERLSREEIRPIDNLDAPAVDRGLENMVQRVYDQMAHHATHDELTGLFNRREFERRLKQRLLSNEHSATLFHIDIDQFKVVNTYGGPDAGDEMIRQMAKLISAGFPGALIARLSGDEFAVWVESIPPEAAKKMAESFSRDIGEQRFICADKPFTVTVSIGVAHRDSTADVSGLLRDASSACLAAKESGRNRVQAYTHEDESMAKQDDVMAWVARLNDAIDNNRLLLRCQRIEATTQEEQRPSYEVLISIETPEGELLAPSEFLHAAERYNRMHALDRWVVSNVLRWMYENPDVVEGLDHLSINLSGHSLNDAGLLEFLFDHFQRYPVPRERICFEVTETAAIANLEDAADFIYELQGLGCRFSLDDFGSGLASYGHLKHLPVDYIKIDGSFIKDVADDPADLALVRSINEMGHLMGKRTIAEYVENDRIRECMRSIGVDYVQGYGVEKPRTLESLASPAA
jgi:diguanylate cyclase (GGDEF)-like protein